VKNMKKLSNLAFTYKPFYPTITCKEPSCMLKGFLVSNWSAGFGTLLQVSALASHWLGIVQILRQRRRKMTLTAPTTLSAIQAASPATFINAQLYSTCDYAGMTKISS
jgi:hypothetical protein